MTKKLIIYKTLKESSFFKADKYMGIYNLLSAEENSNVSLVLAKLDGVHTNRVNYKSTKIFYVLEGSLKIKSDFIKKEMTKDSMICVPPNIWIELKGNKCKFIIICTPSFNFDDEKIK